MTMPKLVHATVCGLLLLGILCFTGCQTADEAHSGHTASITLSGYSRSEIKQAITKAFSNADYTETAPLTFDQPGSAWDTINYGGWSAGRAWVRMRVGILSVAPEKFVLYCDAYVVEGHGEIGTEEEQKFWFPKRDKCKKMLDAVQAVLAKSGKGTAPHSN